MPKFTPKTTTYRLSWEIELDSHSSPEHILDALDPDSLGDLIEEAHRGRWQGARVKSLRMTTRDNPFKCLIEELDRETVPV